MLHQGAKGLSALGYLLPPLANMYQLPGPELLEFNIIGEHRSMSVEKKK